MNGDILKQQLEREQTELSDFIALRYKMQQEEEFKRQEDLRRLSEAREEIKRWKR